MPMVSDSIVNLLTDSEIRINYLTYINNLENIYDKETIISLYESLRLHIEGMSKMRELLYQRFKDIEDITYITKIYIEKYEFENKVEYIIFPQIIPNIPSGDKLAFVKPGKSFNDEDLALAYAHALQSKYNGEIIKKYC